MKNLVNDQIDFMIEKFESELSDSIDTKYRLWFDREKVRKGTPQTIKSYYAIYSTNHGMISFNAEGYGLPEIIQRDCNCVFAKHFKI